MSEASNLLAILNADDKGLTVFDVEGLLEEDYQLQDHKCPIEIERSFEGKECEISGIGRPREY